MVPCEPAGKGQAGGGCQAGIFPPPGEEEVQDAVVSAPELGDTCCSSQPWANACQRTAARLP